MAAAAEIAIRNSKIVEMRLSHPTMTMKDIAKQFKVSERTAYAACEAHSAEQRRELVGRSENYMNIVAEIIADFKRLRSEAMKTFTTADNSSSKIGALKLILELHREEISLLQRTRLMPQDLGIVRVQLDIDYLADKVIELIEKYVPKDRRSAAEETLMEALKPRPVAALPPAPDET